MSCPPLQICLQKKKKKNQQNKQKKEHPLLKLIMLVDSEM